MDSSTYVPGQSNPLVQFMNPDAERDDVPVKFGEALFRQLRLGGDQSGGALYTIGLSLLDSASPRAASILAMAADAKRVFGTGLDAFLLGNEPDAYSGHKKRPTNYNTQDYISEWEVVSNQLRGTSPEDNMLSSPILGGPSICCSWDLAMLIQQGFLDRFKKYLKYISLQHYPRSSCSNGKHTYNLDYYLKHQEVVSLVKWQARGIDLARQQGVPIMMSEYNSASCGGIPNISDTFAAGTMWVMDYGLQLASVGFSVAFVHQREPGISYNLFDAPFPAGSPGPWVTRPGYYALLVMPEILNAPAGSHVVDLNLGNSMFDAKKDMAGYAIYDADSLAINRIALFNYANATTNAHKTFVLHQEVFKNATSQNLPGVSATQVTVKYLTAPNTNNKVDIAWAGRTYDGVGNGKPNAANDRDHPGQMRVDCSNGCSINVPGPGVAIVFVGSTDAAEPTTTTSAGGSAASIKPTMTMSPTGSAGSNKSTTATGASGSAATASETKSEGNGTKRSTMPLIPIAFASGVVALISVLL